MPLDKRGLAATAVRFCSVLLFGSRYVTSSSVTSRGACTHNTRSSLGDDTSSVGLSCSGEELRPFDDNVDDDSSNLLQKRDPMLLALSRTTSDADIITMVACPKKSDWVENVPQRCDSSASKLNVRCCSPSGAKVAMETYCPSCGQCSNKTFSEAVSVCSASNLSLCTVEDLHDLRTCGSGCVMDYARIWTGNSCGYTTTTTTHPESSYRRRRSMPWPAEEDSATCEITAKQKSMWVYYTFNPSLKSMPTKDMKVAIRWEDLHRAPWYGGSGNIYAAWQFTMTDHSGYFGSINYPDSMPNFLFSIWDGDRWNGAGASRQPKPSTALVWPLNLRTCKRNCQDCSLPDLQKWRQKGLTTGTQCSLEYSPVRFGGLFELRAKMIDASRTINTKDFGGMPGAHLLINESDREITGAVWSVSMVDTQSNESYEVGELLFEGTSEGITGLSGSFNEAPGCIKCNDLFNRNTRYGPFLEDGELARRPVAARVKVNEGSSCTLYGARGSKEDASVTVEMGPGTTAADIIPSDGSSRELWH